MVQKRFEGQFVCLLVSNEGEESPFAKSHASVFNNGDNYADIDREIQRSGVFSGICKSSISVK